MKLNSSFLERLLFDSKFWFLRHFLFWLFMYAPEFLDMFSYAATEEDWFDIHLIIALLFDVTMVYLNLYYLIPKFLMKRKFASYFLLSALTIFASILGADLYHQFVCSDCEFDFLSFTYNFVFTASLLASGTAIKLFKYAFRNRIKYQELQELNMKSNLKNLQDQVNPHFLFNALNSIYVQAKKGSNQVPESIMQLSELMRYQTYDSQKDLVKLKDEIEYYKNYLNVEKDRRDQLKIGFIVKDEVENLNISPLLFLPLIENAVKYSQRSDDSGSNIHVSFALNEKKELLVSVVNNKADFDVNKDRASGSGLENLTKRLEILYPDHDLNISDLEDKYFVELRINLDSHLIKQE